MTSKLSCRVEQVIDHGERVYTVILRPERPAPRFRAGQFLHLALDPYDPTRFWPESRVFSIASPPSQRDLLRIVYSVRGQFTARMETSITEGQQVWIKLPYGDFIVDERRDVVLFAGGTGISAFTAFLEGLPATSPQTVVIGYGARTSDLLICRDAIDRCAARVASLRAFYFVESAPDGTGTTGDAEQARPAIGRVSVAAIWPRLSRPLEAEHYISGPPAMLKVISQDLKVHGVSPAAIHIDAWE